LDTTPHVSGLIGVQIEPTLIQDEDVCVEDDRVATWDTLSEGNDISTYDGQEDSTSDHEDEVASTPCDEVHDDLGVDTPKDDGALTHGDSSMEHGLTLQDVHMTA
jgi:hypothetical protein